jgi:hypothetical protein
MDGKSLFFSQVNGRIQASQLFFIFQNIHQKQIFPSPKIEKPTYLQLHLLYLNSDEPE